jgi:hypothetical protein
MALVSSSPLPSGLVAAFWPAGWARRVRRPVWWWQPLADVCLLSSPSPEVVVAACGADDTRCEFVESVAQ